MDPFNGLNDAVKRAYAGAATPAYEARDVAPDTVEALLESYAATGRFIVWSGGSATSIYRDPDVNYRFRAWHDWSHHRTRMGFTVADEVALARWQCAEAARIVGDRLADVVWLEIAGQALEYERTGSFIEDQRAWTLAQLAEGTYRVR